MENQQNGDDILYRLEAAVGDWNTRVTQTCTSVSEQLRDLKARLGALRRIQGDGQSSAAGLAEAKAKIERLTHVIEQRAEELDAATQQIAQLKETVAKSYAELQELRENAQRAAAAERVRTNELEEVRAELSNAREQVAAARMLSGKVDELKALLETERERAEKLEAELHGHEEAQEQAEAALRQELAQARRELDEDQERIKSLNAQIATLRRANASLSAPVKPDDEGGGAIVFKPLDEDGRKRRMGEILVDAGVITQGELETALNEQQTRPQRRLGATLVQMGLTSDEVVARVLGHQLGLPFVRLTDEAVDAEATQLVVAQLARNHACIPISVSSDHVVLAMANPFDLIAIDDIELASGKRVEPVVAGASDISAAIARYYGATEET